MTEAKAQPRRVLDACRPDTKREPHPIAGPRHPNLRQPRCTRRPATTVGKRWP